MDPLRRRDAVFLALGFEGALLLLAYLLGWLFNQPPLSQTRWTTRHLGLGLAATVPLLVGLFIVVRWPIGPLRRIMRISDEFIQPIFRRCTAYDLALVSLLAGLGEEMLFRGVVQGLSDRWFGVGYGLAVASVLFGLVHLITPTYAVLATMCGVYFGVLVMLTENLLVVIVAHALYDFIALLYILRWSRPGSGSA
jgi:membrane protease YdiL (CAAX protease family)